MLQRLPRRAEGGRGDPGTAVLGLVRGGQNDPRTDPARRRELPHPPELDETLDVGRARVPREDERGVLLLLTDERGIACVDSRTERLGKERVAVVPDEDRADIVGGCVHGGSVPDDDAGSGAQHPEVRRVSLRPRAPGVVADDRVSRDQGRESVEELRLVAVVGDDEKRTPAAAQDQRGEAREQVRQAPRRAPGVGCGGASIATRSPDRTASASPG